MKKLREGLKQSLAEVEVSKFTFTHVLKGTVFFWSFLDVVILCSLISTFWRSTPDRNVEVTVDPKLKVSDCRKLSVTRQKHSISIFDFFH